MQTLTEILGRHHITVPDDLLAELEVPVLTGPQRQGDVLIVPRSPLTPGELKTAMAVPRKGVAVVFGEATGNTHMLDAVQGQVLWLPKTAGVLLGVLYVPDDGEAYLVHTDEHGANGIGPGTYVLHGKREQAEEIRRVAD